jgi:uncharacterized phage-associated protein
MTTAKDVAKFFLSKTREEIGESITHLKLQKLLYYAQGFSLAIFDTPIFEERIEAWDHGPVVPDLYQEYKAYKANPLPGVDVEEASRLFTTEQMEMLNDVYEVYGQFSAWKLRAMTHSEPTWEKAYPGGIISHADMKRYFSTLVVE